MGRREDEKAEADNAALVLEITRRNPLRSQAAAEAWDRYRDALEAVRANVVDALVELHAAAEAFDAVETSDKEG